jgi:hypothetical protein
MLYPFTFFSITIGFVPLQKFCTNTIPFGISKFGSTIDYSIDKLLFCKLELTVFSK